MCMGHLPKYYVRHDSLLMRTGEPYPVARIDTMGYARFNGEPYSTARIDSSGHLNQFGPARLDQHRALDSRQRF